MTESKILPLLMVTSKLPLPTSELPQHLFVHNIQNKPPAVTQYHTTRNPLLSWLTTYPTARLSIQSRGLLYTSHP